jgi:glutathione S-transferase
MLELYHAKISTCSQKVRLVLAEKKIVWKSNIINLAMGQQLSPEYLKINPNGVVPTLVDHSHIVRDSTVINEYIEDVHASKPLRPTDPKLVARMREWQQYIDEVPTPAVRPLSFNAFFLPIWSGVSDKEFFEYTERLPLRKHFYRKIGKIGIQQGRNLRSHGKAGPNAASRRRRPAERRVARRQPLYAGRRQSYSDHRAPGGSRPRPHVA